MSLWISPAVPRNLAEAAQGWGLPAAASRDSAVARLEPVTSEDGQSGHAANEIYALAAAFPTVTDDISLAALKSAWA